MDSKYKISTKNIEKIEIRETKGTAWSDIMIEDYGHAGRLTIVSDFGNWSYYWGDCGPTFKDFLIRLDIGYFASKIGMNKYFDYEKTMEKIRQDIYESINEGNLTKQSDIDDVWYDLDLFKSYGAISKEGYIGQFRQHK